MINKFIQQHWFKVGILGVVILAFILGSNYLNAQNDFAREQAEQARIERDRAYAADQKEACLAIYKQEDSKWNNVRGWRYDATNDTCYVAYKDGEAKTDAECEAEYSEYRDEDGILPLYLYSGYLNCKDGTFENSF